MPSRAFAVRHVHAHAGTALELSVPIILLSTHAGTSTTVGIVLMLVLHGFITSNVPMGVPIEWNVMMVYGDCFSFGSRQARVFST